jgi:hypothetical protein
VDSQVTNLVTNYGDYGGHRRLPLHIGKL